MICMDNYFSLITNFTPLTSNTGIVLAKTLYLTVGKGTPNVLEYSVTVYNLVASIT